MKFVYSGYTRIILAGLSLHFMGYHPKYCTLLYGISCLLDAVDGQAARALGQTSKFGAVLDMVTDRLVRLPVTTTSADTHADVQHPACYAFSPQPTHHMLHFSNSSSHSISVAIICTCTGEYCASHPNGF
jgi:hypothetical protein